MILLMDLQMPFKDGYQTTEYIRNEMNSNIPIIAMTAHSLVGEQERCFKIGMDAYVPKPFKQQLLLETIKTVINKDNKAQPKRKIDLSYLDDLSCGNPNFKQEMIALFIEKIPNEAIQLEEAIQNIDHDKVKKLSHNMKSSIDLFMLDDLSHCLSVIEQEAKSGQFTETSNKITVLQYGIADVIKILKEL
ncbi:response regulator [Flavobacterium palustre]|uniref:response regulator n=1 Tax=Flavobacterium palustre TaxID=1476463 RepID=UPI003615BAB5